MKYVLSLLALVFTINSYGQITITDTPHCFYHGLHAGVTGGLVPTSSGITVDDGWSGVIPIGFSYTFYGAANTQCVIGSNGCLGFNLGSAGAYNTWPIGATLATTTATDIRNVICAPWCDVLLSAGGTIEYSTQGVAPFRNFAVTWCGAHMFGCTSEWLTTQIIIYETTGLAEVHIGHRTICSSGWNGSKAIVGVKNAAGTVSTVAPGRDFPAIWATTNEAWRFTPASGPTYTVSSIPYAPIPYASSLVYWYDSATHAYLGSGPDLPVAPTVGTTYMAAVIGCSDSLKAYIHVPVPTGLTSGGLPSIDSITPADYIHPTVCGKCNGEIVLKGIKPHQIDTLIYSIGGVRQPARIDSAALDSTIRFTALCANTYDYFFIKVGDCPSDTVGPVTLAAPPFNADFTHGVDLGCGVDYVSFYNSSLPVTPEYTSTWDFGDGSPVSTSFSPVHGYSMQGTYTAKLTYATIYGCQDTATAVIPLLHPLDAHFTVNANAVCLGTPISFTASTISTDMPTYVWNFGDGTPIRTDTTFDYIYPAPGRYTTTLTVTDSIGCDSVATDTFEVIFIDVNTTTKDTSVCLRDSMFMQALVDVVPSDVSYSYLWTPDNNIGATTERTTNFSGIGTFVYTVTVTTAPLVLNPFGCIASNTETIHSYPPVSLTDLTVSGTTIPYGSSIQLNALGAVYYTWKPNNGTLNNDNINNPIATPRDSITVYTVYGMNLYGCIDSANITVKLDNDMPEGIPTAFTPNGDGLNDVFKVTKLTFQNLVDFRVFNRWGQEIFQTNNREIGWDGTFHGTPQDIGTYNYVIIVGHVTGNNTVYKGSVTLIR